MGFQVIVASLLPRASKTKDNLGEGTVNREERAVGNLVAPAHD